MSTSILLIDDHPTFRAGLGLVLRRLDSAVMVHEVASVGGALDRLESHRHDLIVYDWYLPDGGGLPGLTALLQYAPGTPLVVMSSTMEATVEPVVLEVGARAYIPKSAEADQIVQTLRSVLARTGAAAAAANMPATRATAGRPSPSRVDAAFAERLTARQLEVLKLVADGHPNKEISRRLHIAEATARDHVSAVLMALCARNRTEAVAIAARHGLIAHPTGGQ